MKRKIKTVVLGSFITGALMTPALGLADNWHWSTDHNRWDHRADLRSDYRDLARARQQLEQDRLIMRVVVNSPRMRHGLGISSVKLMQIDERDDRYVINAMAI